MRHVYLIRHGHPDFPIGSRICLGQTDTPLGPLGHLQGVLLAHTFAQQPLTVYTSPLRRACDTARHLTPAPIVRTGLSERATGLWDGLSFAEIAQRWPEEYAQRGDDPARTMPGGEALATARARFAATLAEILQSSAGDLAIVAHKGVIDAFLQTLSQRNRLPKLAYGAYWHLLAANATLSLGDDTPIQPQPPLARALCLALLEAVVPFSVCQHCEAVEGLALAIAAQLPQPLDVARLSQAALLHDIARLYPDHAHLGAAWLDQLGYSAVASIVRCHHDLDNIAINEASIVYIADKCLSTHALPPAAKNARLQKRWPPGKNAGT